ncbi:hypothetical protein [Aureimonas mangrovi]|uniref:hypothetical protein n=1 Tax=Aureimonas mangrovi TaxID=2758041 RepID=UPI00163D8B31|nr:hypothetical protein [Aureimonas mangrovi]
MRARFAAFTLVLATLAGCTTMTPAERRAADEASCRDYGFRNGTDAFAECLQRIDLSREADRRAWRNNDPFYGRPSVVYSPVIVR